MECESRAWDSSCVSDLVFTETTMKYLWDSVSSSPLFSTIVTFYALVLLYLPNHFLSIVFSPVLIITGALLLTLLRHGANQRLEDRELKEEERQFDSKLETEFSVPNDSSEVVQEQIASALQVKDRSFVTYQFETDERERGFDQYANFDDCFVEWNVKAPLEVIYEEYEGREEDEENDLNSKNQALNSLGRQPSLSMYYPEESDSDASSDGDFSVTGAWDLPENMCYKWEEDDREGLIEISLDGSKKSIASLQFQVEEENLIEIDISPTRSNDFGGDKWLFPGEVRFS